MELNAAHNLEGKILKTGWKVIEKITKSEVSTGSFFSVCYKVEKDSLVCFLKAFDFAKFNILSEAENPEKSVVDIIGDMVKAYQYERDLSNHCRKYHVTNVAFVKEASEEIFPEFVYSLVPYLIFDLADGDVRKHLAYSENLDLAWKLSSLHSIAVGLKQLHSIGVSHQDLKPSNILLYNKSSKLGDLGRSLCKDIDGPYKTHPFTGDYNYAPPEIMYGYYEKDWTKRVFATDCYLLGSMIVFYFTGISMSALLMKNILPEFRIEYWRGSIDEVKPYIADGFTKAITEFQSCIFDSDFSNDLRQIVEQLCFPFPEQRGHPKSIISNCSNYNLDRYVTWLNLLHNRAQYKIRK